MLAKFSSNSDFRLFVIVVYVLSPNTSQAGYCNLKEAGDAVLLLMYIEACETLSH